MSRLGRWVLAAGFVVSCCAGGGAAPAARLPKKLPAKRAPAQEAPTAAAPGGAEPVVNVIEAAVAKPSEKAPEKLPEKLTHEIVYHLFKTELDKSLKKIVQTRVVKTTKIENLLAKAEDPWTFSNKLHFVEDEVTPKYREYTSTSTIKYSTQRGFVFQGYVDMYDNTAFYTAGNNFSTRNSHSNLGFSVSQDLFTLRSKTVFDYNIEITELQTRAKLIAADETFLAETLKVVDSSFGLFTSLCKRQDLELIVEMAQQTFRIAEIQAAAKTIGARDFLRVKETLLGLLRQQRSNIYEIDSYQRQLAGVSPSAEELAKRISRERVYCESNLDVLKNVKYPPREEVQGLIRKYPSLLSAEISRDVAKKKFESYRKQRQSSLQLSAGIDQTNNLGPPAPYVQAYVGLLYTYQFKGEQFDLNKQNVQEQLNDLSVGQKQTTLNVTSYLMGFYDDIEFYSGQVEMTKNSIQNSSKLLKILETQQSIGQLDATAIDSAFQAYTNALADQRELVTKVSLISLKLSEIKQVIQNVDQFSSDKTHADQIKPSLGPSQSQSQSPGLSGGTQTF